MRNVIGLISGRGARVGAGMAAMVALAVGLWPWVPSQVDVPKSLAFISAFVVWLFAELSGLGDAHPNDVALIRKISLAFDESERSLLRDHDMHGPIPREAFHGTWAVGSAWRGAQHEFVDPFLQRKWLTLLQLGKTFSNEFAVNTFPIRGMEKYSTVKTHAAEEHGEWDELSSKRAQKLNDLASEFVQRIDEFERLALKRLNVSLSSQTSA